MLQFTKFKGAMASDVEQQFIKSVLKDLENPYSFYTSLQMTYNNNHHFGYSFKGLDISHLIEKMNNDNDIVEIKGQIHTNSHSTNLLVNAYSGSPLFVTDTYIQVYIPSSDILYHILLQQPKLHNFEYWLYLGNYINFIPPSF
jgi:hypothetical protein